MKRLVFLDVDGTLIDHTQQVPPSAREAVGAALREGHTLVLCTGRSLPEVYPHLWDLGFHGIVSANGAYVRMGSDVLADVRLCTADVREVSQVIGRLGGHYLWQTPDLLYPSEDFAKAFTEMAGSYGGEWGAYLDFIRPRLREGLPESASKCTFTLPTATGRTLEDVENSLSERYSVIAGSVSAETGVSGELVAAGVSKGAGVVRVAEHLGVDIADTVAIGDSANDIAMLEVAGLAIAMGNGTPEAKASADWVSASVFDDGLAKALDYALR